ncbi:MAG: hypothetical protein WAQ52_02945 [Terriglobales bacterium]
MALLIALLALLLISAIGLGMMYMSNTETGINANYKDTQTAFFAVRAGLEEMRDRMRKNSITPVTLPTAMPPAAHSILYITNPAGAADTVDPATWGNLYFDDELCHENFVPGLPSSSYSTPCTAAGAPPAGSYSYVPSFSPNTNTVAALKYKWVRITLKQNATVGTGAAQWVDSTQPADSPVCWDAMNNREVASTSLGYATCDAATAAGFNVAPTYLVTSLAITPQGSRRVGQYESAALNIAPPPAALALDGPAAQFSPAPSSNNYFANGNDSGVSGYAGPGTCTPTGPSQVPAISTGDATSVTDVTNSIPHNRYGNYTGTGGTPSIVNAGPGGTNQLSGSWSSPSQLNTFVSDLANAADVSYSCGIGAPCSGSGPYGTNAAPQITYVNGDFNFGANSGSGVLVVTGTLNITGQSSFNGLILVIGQGVMTEQGGGSGQFNGSIFLAKTNSSTSPYPQLTTLGTPLIAWNGGGTNGIQYNSCWANIGNNLHFLVVASREEMY